MKKLVAGALALSVVTTMSMAYNDFYIGVGTAMEMVEGYNGSDDTGTAIELKIGKVFDNNFGIEGKITKTMTSAEVDVEANELSYYPDAEIDLMTYSIWAMYHHKLTNDLTISPKIGFLKEDGSVKPKGVDSIEGDDSEMVYGIDIKKNLPSYGFDIYAGYNIVDKDISHLSFGIQKNF